MTKKRKYNFILIEIIIALVLVMLCIFPLLALHYRLLQKENEMLIESHVERFAKITFAEIKQKFYEGDYSFNNFRPLILSYPKVTIERKVSYNIEKSEENLFLVKAFIELKADRIFNFEYYFITKNHDET